MLTIAASRVRWRIDICILTCEAFTMRITHKVATKKLLMHHCICITITHFYVSKLEAGNKISLDIWETLIFLNNYVSIVYIRN